LSIARDQGKAAFGGSLEALREMEESLLDCTEQYWTGCQYYYYQLMKLMSAYSRALDVRASKGHRPFVMPSPSPPVSIAGTFLG
jgi:hypothetical protein